MNCIQRLTSAATIFALSICATAGRAAIQYTITDLGPQGTIYAYDNAWNHMVVNSFGQVTGAGLLADSQIARVWNPTAPNGTTGTTFSLGGLSSSYSQTASINASGQVAGLATLSGGQNHAFMWKPTSPNGTTGTMYDLGTLGGSDSNSTSINDTGEVTGVANNSAFLWKPIAANGTVGAMYNLGTLGSSSEGDAINASGQVVGYAIIGFNPHPFLWTPTVSNGTSGTMLDLMGLGGDQGGQANGINAGGKVVGSSYTTDNAAFHAFLYDGTVHDLGTLPGGSTSNGLAINDLGQVVGLSDGPTADFHAFLYSSGTGMVDLNSLIDPQAGWTLISAGGINNAGQIAGYGSFGDQGLHSFLLTPVPEPASVVVAALAAFAAGPFLYRKAIRNE